MSTQAEAAYVYAGFWRRAAAFCIDLALLFLLRLPLSFLLGFLGIFGLGRTPVFFHYTRTDLLMLLTQAVYFCCFTGAFGATPGKRMLRLRVVCTRTDRLGWFDAVYRETVGRILNTCSLFIGYLLVIFDPQKRTLGDRFCDTLVVVAPPKAAPRSAAPQLAPVILPPPAPAGVVPPPLAGPFSPQGAPLAGPGKKDAAAETPPPFAGVQWTAPEIAPAVLPGYGVSALGGGPAPQTAEKMPGPALGQPAAIPAAEPLGQPDLPAADSRWQSAAPAKGPAGQPASPQEKAPPAWPPRVPDPEGILAQIPPPQIPEIHFPDLPGAGTPPPPHSEEREGPLAERPEV